MKVKIKNYHTWWGPYNTFEKLFWFLGKKGEYRMRDFPKWFDTALEKYANSRVGWWHADIASKHIAWVESRRVSVHIDKWDTYNVDDTLSVITVPLLEQLKETQDCASFVDFEDVPEDLRPQDWQHMKKHCHNDCTLQDRWDWVLGEMIFAHRSNIEDWEEQFYNGKMDNVSVPVDIDGNDLEDENHPDFFGYRWDKGPNDTFEVDDEGRQAYQDRIDNGFRLFGKYYQRLWS